jgi:hypothetical protein
LVAGLTFKGSGAFCDEFRISHERTFVEANRGAHQETPGGSWVTGATEVFADGFSDRGIGAVAAFEGLSGGPVEGRAAVGGQIAVDHLGGARVGQLEGGLDAHSAFGGDALFEEVVEGVEQEVLFGGEGRVGEGLAEGAGGIEDHLQIAVGAGDRKEFDEGAGGGRQGAQASGDTQTDRGGNALIGDHLGGGIFGEVGGTYAEAQLAEGLRDEQGAASGDIVEGLGLVAQLGGGGFGMEARE